MPLLTQSILFALHDGNKIPCLSSLVLARFISTHRRVRVLLLLIIITIIISVIPSPRQNRSPSNHLSLFLSLTFLDSILLWQRFYFYLSNWFYVSLTLQFLACPFVALFSLLLSVLFNTRSIKVHFFFFFFFTVLPIQPQAVPSPMMFASCLSV